MKHTPTPWIAEGRAIDSETFEIATLTRNAMDMDENIITAGELEANAAFIVRACNTHGELLEVVKEAARYFDRYLSTNRVHPLRNKLVEAIAKAEGGEE